MTSAGQASAEGVSQVIPFGVRPEAEETRLCVRVPSMWGENRKQKKYEREIMGI